MMEHLLGGTLLEMLNRGIPLMSDVHRIFSQLVVAVYHLHHHANFVHRDIRLENILFDEHMNARLIELTLAKILEEPGKPTTTICGSLPYCAPEICQPAPWQTC
jgi:serine/threonine protein kinase